MDTIARLAADPASWAALATLIAMEVVLGVDNLVFIALLSNRVAAGDRPKHAHGPYTMMRRELYDVVAATISASRLGAGPVGRA